MNEQLRPVIALGRSCPPHTELHSKIIDLADGEMGRWGAGELGSWGAGGKETLLRLTATWYQQPIVVQNSAVGVTRLGAAFDPLNLRQFPRSKTGDAIPIRLKHNSIISITSVVWCKC